MYATSIESPVTRIVPVAPSNKIKMITKQEDGGLLVEQYSGNSFTIAKDDSLFQEFAVWMILGDGF